MTDQLDDSNLEIDDLSEILGIIDLSQIHHLPSIDLWSNKDYKQDVLSDVSSQSDEKSSISGSLDSVSVVSSSESEDSCVSADDSQDPNDPNLLYGVNFNRAQSLLFEGQNFGIKYHVNTLSHLMKDLNTIFKYLPIQSKCNVESILCSSFEVFQKVHRTVCILSSLGYLTHTSEMVKSVRIKNLIGIFKKIYSDFASFHTHMCKLLSTDVNSTISSKLIELMPLLIDTFFCILRFLLCYIKQKNTQSDMINIFVNILNYCTLLCCSYLDHSEEILNKVSVFTIYRLAILFIPLECVYNVITEDTSTKTLDHKPDYKSIIEPLLEEYLSDEFKPSTLVLEKLRSFSYENKSDKFEAELKLTKMTRESLETCIVTGVTRRQYPTFQIDPIGFFDLVTNNPLPEMWKKVNFWLLQRLDSHHSEIRRTSLNIVRHGLCTINFNERDRQHILSYAYNCLTDDETLPNSLSLLMYASRLYPLKDGAVRRIANLTLKGLRKDVKLKVLEFFSKCNYTQKGLEFLLTVLKSLCNYSYESFDLDHKASENFRNSGEIKFVLSDWPKIVDILQSVSKTHKNIAKLVVPTDDVTPYITQKRLRTIPVSIWVSLLWSYLTNTDDDRWRLFKCLWFSEAKIRFPSIVKTLSEEDKKLFDAYCRVNDEFVNFGTDGKPDISIGFVKDLNNWKILHEVRISYPFDHLDKTSALFMDEFTLDTDKDMFGHFGDGCKCVDCRMDLVITDIDSKTYNNSSSNKNFPYDPFSSIFSNTKCELMDDYKAEPPEVFELKSQISELNNHPHEIYSFAMSRFKTEPLNADIKNMALNVDDVDCYEFPAPLGTSISFGFSCKSRSVPSDLVIFYKFPRIINPEVKPDDLKSRRSNSLPLRVDYSRPKLRLDENEPDLYHGTVSFNIKFPYATSIPFPVDFYYRLHDDIKKFGHIWIHPKRSC